MDAAVAGLLGAAIGAGTSLVTVWVQAHYQSKREQARFILEYATSDRLTTIDEARERGVGGPVPPVALFAHYNQGLIKLLEGGKLSKSELKRLADENDDLWKAIREIDEQRER